MSRNPALLLVDHGSRRHEANDLLPRIAGLLREMSSFKIIHFAHMELAEPTIQQGFDACVSDGADEVIVHPYFLGPGRHSTSDIPRMVAQAAARHQGVSVQITEPLGVHPKIGELILERIRESLASRPENDHLT
jgi:sirohydrochlorin ferrochelatase